MLNCSVTSLDHQIADLDINVENDLKSFEKELNNIKSEISRYYQNKHNNANRLKCSDNNDNDDYKNKEETLSTLLNEAESSSLKNPFVIIIGIENYDNVENWPILDGVSHDIKQMSHLWSKIFLYHNVEIISNAKDYANSSNYNKNKMHNININNGKEILKNRQSLVDCLREMRSTINHNKSNDGLILCYSGHGTKTSIVLPNGHPVRLTDIYSIFDGKECVHLRDKPKILVLDCCRGKDITDSHKAQINTVKHRGKVINKQHEWIHHLFHPSSGFATIYANCENYAVHDSQNGGNLMRSISKVFSKPELIENYSLRELIIAIRRQTKISAGKGNVECKATAQCVDFHESLEYKVYFAQNT